MDRLQKKVKTSNGRDHNMYEDDDNGDEGYDYAAQGGYPQDDDEVLISKIFIKNY
jgi:hypothetical protein